jgi:hypothetical protein
MQIKDIAVCKIAKNIFGKCMDSYIPSFTLNNRLIAKMEY